MDMVTVFFSKKRHGPKRNVTFFAITGRGGPVGVGELSDCPIEGERSCRDRFGSEHRHRKFTILSFLRADDRNRLPYADTNFDIAGTITDLLTLTFNTNLL